MRFKDFLLHKKRVKRDINLYISIKFNGKIV